MTLKTIDPITGFRRLFYLVTPNETSFEKLEEVPDYVQDAYLYFFLLIALEYIISRLKGQPKARVNDAISSISAGVVSQLPMLFIRSIEISAYIWVYEHFCLINLPWNSPWTWLLAFFGEELAYYWLHRMSHEINLAWSGHQVHHSSETYNLTTALRQSLLQRYFGWMYYLPMALMVPPSIFLVHIQFNLIYQFWIHTEVIRTLGPLEWILNTPSHHRVHHGRNPYCIDKNYGGTLIIFDLIFGTFQKEVEDEPLAYGLVHPLTTWDPIDIQLCHLKYVWRTFWEREGIINKLWTLIKGPGWTPGKPRLGDPADLPPVSPPVPFYDPVVANWIKAYSFVHFFLLFGLYLGFLVLKDSVSPLILLGGVVYLLLGLSAVGNLMDPATARYGMTLEILRCVMFLVAATFTYLIYYPIEQYFFLFILTNGVFLSSAIIWITEFYDGSFGKRRLKET